MDSISLEMGADGSRLFSPSEEEEGIFSYRGLTEFIEQKEPTTTTIDIGFAIRSNGVPKKGNFRLGALHRTVSQPRLHHPALCVSCVGTLGRYWWSPLVE